MRELYSLPLVLAILTFACASANHASEPPPSGPPPSEPKVAIGATQGARPVETESEEGGRASTRSKELLEEARRAKDAKDLETARAKASQAIEALLGVESESGAEDRIGLLAALGDLARSAGDLKEAERAQRKVLEFRTKTLPEDDPGLQSARTNLAITIKALGDLAGARALFEQVLAVRSKTFPDEHLDLQRARGNLAATMQAQGDLAGARTLQEKILEVLARTLPDDHSDLQRARQNLAGTIFALGDLAGARALVEKVLEIQSRTLADDDQDLQSTRGNLALVIRTLGDLAGARALQQKVLDVLARTLPDDHPDLQAARQNLAATLFDLGELTRAREIEKKVLDVLSGSLPDDHPNLQLARLNLSSTLEKLGDLEQSKALAEKVLQVRARTLPDDHPDLQAAREGVAVTMWSLGDLDGARLLFEKVLEVRSRTLPDDHPDLQKARLNVANALDGMGDPAAARDLYEKVLEVESRTLPDDHPDLQMARQNLAGVLDELGDRTGARALDEKVFEVRSRTLPEDHRDFQAARGNLATALLEQGENAEACDLYQKVVDVFSRTLPDEHPDLQKARSGLAKAKYALGDLEAARVLFEKLLVVQSHALPGDHPDLLRTRWNVAVTIAMLAAASRAGEADSLEDSGSNEGLIETRFDSLIRSFADGLRRSSLKAIVESSPREAEERISSRTEDLGFLLSSAKGLDVFTDQALREREAFLASETMRSTALASARLARRARSDPAYDAKRARVREATAEFVRLAQAGAGPDDLARSQRDLESAERDLVRLAASLNGGPVSLLTPEIEELSADLQANEAMVAYRSYDKMTIETGLPPGVKRVQSLCAFVLRKSFPSSPKASTNPANLEVGGLASLERVELGPIEPIAAAAERWREAVGVAIERGVSRAVQPFQDFVQGEELRKLVLDPLRTALTGVTHVIVVPDDVLHSVPLDALPTGEAWRPPVGTDTVPPRLAPREPLGSRVSIEVRSSLFEKLNEVATPAGPGSLLAVGHAAFDIPPAEEVDSTSAAKLESSPADVAKNSEDRPALASTPERSGQSAGRLRGSAWERGFPTLPETRAEVRAIGDYFEEVFGRDAGRVLLERCRASRENLFELAPKARFLHVATHGWFAPESVRSFEDPEPIDKLTGLVRRMSGEERARGMSPMLLCGLALAGANLPVDATGRIPGLVTAEELSTLDLSNCELAVLSACDTNVGVRRAGQGVASLQRALHMAGARTVITSLWKVPDEATKELMVDFYRRIWVEKKPKGQALWEAKMKIRSAKDEAGHPKYTLRDWAAWVLTGDSR